MKTPWIVFAVALVPLSALLHSVTLLVAGSLIITLATTSRLWAKYSLSRVEYHHSLSASRAFIDEEVKFTVQVTNRKFLPLPWVQITDEIPMQLRPLQGHTIQAPHPRRVALTSAFSMSWYHRITRTYTLRCEHRGHFYLGPTRIRSGDIFGMATQEKDMERDLYLTVYPRVLPLVAARLPSWEPYGNLRVPRTLVEDLTRPVGSREYMVGDSLRHVDWKSTARTGRLQTRIFDSSATANLVLFLGARTIEPPLLGSIPHLLELSVLTTTAMANYALSYGHPVGVYVNQTSPITSQLLQVHPSRHQEQLTRILEVMAQVHPDESVSMAALLLERARSLPWGTSIVVVTAVPDEATMITLARLRRAGWGVALVHIGGGPTKSMTGSVPRYTVPDNPDWRQVQEVVLQ